MKSTAQQQINAIEKPRVCHLTSVHRHNDVRIFQKQCCSLAQADFQVHLIAPEAPREIISGVQLHPLKFKAPNRALRMILAPYYLYQQAKEIDADIYHFHDPELLLIGYLLRKKGKVVLYDAHEDLPRSIQRKHYIPKLLRKPLSSFFEAFENCITNKLSAVISATPTIQRRFSKVNRFGINLNNYPRIAKDTLRQKEVRRGKSLCYIGSISEERGINEMLAAVALSDAKLVLAGTWSPKSLLQKLESSVARERVDFLGLLDRDEVDSLLASSLAGLLLFHPGPNHSDAQPNKLFEYMAAGLPIIASNFPLWRQVIEVHHCGICVDPLSPKKIAEAISLIMENPELAKEMGQRGKEAASNHFNWQEEEKKLITFYKQCLSQQKS